MELTANPLDALVMSQLAAIRQREVSLQRQMKSQMNPAAVETELFELQQHADRLNRMIDAMSITGTSWQPAFAAPAVA